MDQGTDQNQINKIFTHLVTGKDNETHDIARWSWLVATLVVMGGAIWNAFNSHIFIIKDFAESISVIAGAHSASIWAKKDTEPPPIDTPE